MSGARINVQETRYSSEISLAELLTPSSLQTTEACRRLQDWCLHTVPHSPLKHTSSLPAILDPFVRRTSPVSHLSLSGTAIHTRYTTYPSEVVDIPSHMTPATVILVQRGVFRSTLSGGLLTLGAHARGLLCLCVCPSVTALAASASAYN